MTTLSWLLYFADVADNVRSLFGVWLIIPLVAYIFFQVMWIAMRGDLFIGRDGYEEPPFIKQIDSLIILARRIVIALCIVALVVRGAVPEKKTIYMIAGVEFTHTIVTSDSNKALLDKIYIVVNKELDQLLEGK